MLPACSSAGPLTVVEAPGVRCTGSAASTTSTWASALVGACAISRASSSAVCTCVCVCVCVCAQAPGEARPITAACTATASRLGRNTGVREGLRERERKDEREDTAMAGIGERGVLASCRPVRGGLLRDHCSPLCDCFCLLSLILPSIDNDYHLFCLIYVTGADPGSARASSTNPTQRLDSAARLPAHTAAAEYLEPFAVINNAQLLADEAKYCSFGDTVHYVNPPKIFSGCEGSYMYDEAGTPYLDLQMWYSAVNFGYKNKRLEQKMIEQLQTLPQVASQYLHPTKIELAKFIAQDAERKWGHAGRVHFNVGGAQAIEDSLKVVRNASGGKSLMFAFEGGYHGRTLGASSITSSYRYRRRYGHFGDRAQFIPFPYPFRRPKGMTSEEYADSIVREFARKFENEYHAIWDPKTNQCEYAAFYVEPIQGTGGYVVPPPNFFKGLKKVLDDHGVLMVVDEIQMGFWRTGTLWSVENFGVKPDVLVFAKALTNGLNALSGLWAREELINPT